MKTITSNGPQNNLKITEMELSAAREVKEQTKDVLKKMDTALKSVTDLKDQITKQRPSQKDLVNGRAKLLRAGRKITVSFNAFALLVKDMIEKLAAISDPDMMRLKEILVAEVEEFAAGVAAVLDLLEEPGREGFTDSLERITAQIEKRSRNIAEVVNSQLLGHINNDILGKLKISELRFSIRRTARILKQLARRF